ncbi:MAG: hypothetical protein U0931_18140 [Vulcanimicrobiota bacterium]
MSVGTISSTQAPVQARPTGQPQSRPQVSEGGGDRFTPSQPSNPGIYDRRTLQAAGAGSGSGPAYINSPGLDHNRQVCDPNLSNQPLVAEGGRWNGANILNAQSQLDTVGTPQASQQNRCGASSLLAGAVMAGPEATARMAERLGAGSQNPEEAARLNGVRDRLLNGTATHADLSALQDTAYNRYNTDGQAGLTTAEMTAMQRDLAGSVQFDPVGNTTTASGDRAVPRQGHVVEEGGRTLDRIDGLRNGQSFSLGVDTDNDGKFNHWVQVGRDQDGHTYTYDPYPAGNQPHISRPDPNGNVGAYERYTEADMGENAGGNYGRVNVIGGGVTSF